MSVTTIPSTFGTFLGGIGIGELILILVIVLIIFGAGKLPQIGDALGKGIRNFRKAARSPESEDDGAVEQHKELVDATNVPAEPICTAKAEDMDPRKAP